MHVYVSGSCMSKYIEQLLVRTILTRINKLVDALILIFFVLFLVVENCLMEVQ